MPDFLSPDWFSALNATLAGVAAPDGPLRRVVVEFPDAPGATPHAMTLTIGPEASGAAAGDHLAADAVVRVSFGDARAIAEGRLSSADALREGRVKVRGDVDAILPLLEWLLGVGGT